MPVPKGCEGVLKIEALPVGGGLQLIGRLTSYSFDEEAATTQKRYLGSCNQVTTIGAITRSCSFEGDFENDDVGQVLLVVGNTVRLVFYPDEDTGAGTDPQWDGEWAITNRNHSAGPDDDTQTWSITTSQNGNFSRANTW